MHKVIKEKDVNVEILRVLACLSVILFHIKNAPTIFDGKINNLELLKDCVCTICVATFFIISGFFIYRKDNITKNWVNVTKNFIFKIYFPSLVINIVCNVFNDFFIANVTFLDCIKKLDFKTIINIVFDSANGLLFNHFTNSAAHLWFVPSYMLIIIFYPITCFIFRSKKIVIYVVMSIMFIIQLINNIIVYSNNWSLNLLALYIIPVFYSMCGYVLYNVVLPKVKNMSEMSESHISSFLKNNIAKTNNAFLKKKNIINVFKRKITKDGQKKVYIVDKRITIICFMSYVIFMALLFIVEANYLKNVNSAFCYTDWNSVLSLFITIIVSIFILHIKFDDRIHKENSHVDTSNNIVFAKAKTKNQGNYHTRHLDNRLNRGAHISHLDSKIIKSADKNDKDINFTKNDISFDNNTNIGFIKSIYDLLSKKVITLITYIASNTFYIYLIHYIFIVIFRSYQFQNKYMQMFNMNFITKGVGIVIYCSMIFVISLFVSSIFDLKKIRKHSIDE